jgi:hypothetical protein
MVSGVAGQVQNQMGCNFQLPVCWADPSGELRTRHHTLMLALKVASST